MSGPLPSEQLHTLQCEGRIRGYTIRSDEQAVLIEAYAPVGKNWQDPKKNFDVVTFGETYPLATNARDLFRLEDLIEEAVEGIQELTAQPQPITPNETAIRLG